jgi:hypothetical protein
MVNGCARICRVLSFTAGLVGALQTPAPKQPPPGPLALGPSTGKTPWCEPLLPPLRELMAKTLHEILELNAEDEVAVKHAMRR